MTLQDLERRVRSIEDVEEIKRLKAQYCVYCDESFDADGIASLFTEDGVWDGGVPERKAVGRDAIRQFFVDVQGLMSFAVHMVMNPIIRVDGDRAEGIWYLFQACTLADGNKPLWGSARYDEEYVRVNGEWKFKNLKLTSFFWTPYAEGWEKVRTAF